MLLVFTGCERSESIDRDAVIEWSRGSDVQQRAKGVTFMDQDDDGRWVSISTSVMKETDSGLMYAGGEILRSGFLVYPGGHRANTIEKAINIAKRLEGAKYQSEQVVGGNGG